MNATLVHTSSRKNDNAVRIARVAAAGRVKAARIAAEHRREITRNAAVEWVEDLRAAGAVTVGFKVCDDYGKHRFLVAIEHAAHTLASHAGEDVEAWGIDADNAHVGEGW